MFLATTANEEFWDKKEKILFLGEWCKLYPNMSEINKLSFETIPYLWKNTAYLTEKAFYLDKIYEDVLLSITRKLNNYLGLDEDVKYYRIIIGYWLMLYLYSTYDKYNSLLYVKNTYKEVTSFILDDSQFIIPIDSKEYIAYIHNDLFQLQTYSKLLNFMNFNYLVKSIDNPLLQTKDIPKNNNIKFDVFAKVFNLFKKSDITIVSPYFENKLFSYFKLWKKSNNIMINNFELTSNLRIKIDTKFRNEGIKLDSKDDNFLKYIIENILKDIPLSFLEGHKDLRALCSENKISKVYYTANAIYNNDYYKYFLAKNKKIITILSHQHGAAYGVDYIHIPEKYERSIVDKFYTFGWSEDNVKYLPAEKLNKKVKKLTNNILLVLTDKPRYEFRLFYQQSSSQILDDTIKDTISFLKKIDISTLKVRFYPANFGWFIKDRIMDIYPLCNIDNSNFNDSFLNASLIVTEHLGTTFYESIAINKAVIVYINLNTYKFRTDADKYFQELIDVKILHTDIKSVSQHYNRIVDDIDDWWLSEDVQKVVKKFAYKYARISENWVDEWIKEFSEVLEK